MSFNKDVNCSSFPLRRNPREANLSSFPRRREPRLRKENWAPAFAGATVLVLREANLLSFPRRREPREANRLSFPRRREGGFTFEVQQFGKDVGRGLPAEALPGRVIVESGELLQLPRRDGAQVGLARQQPP